MDNLIPVPLPPKKKNLWFEKIETREEALKVIKDNCYAFFLIAFMQTVIGLAIGINLWIDAILYFILGLILLKFNSRVAAILLLILNSIALGQTFMNKINPDTSIRTGGTNVFLAAVMLWASIRIVQASFKIHKLGKI